MPLAKVVIIGGGVAGLSAAHELKERGFTVTVYERKANPHPAGGPAALGGKARSFPLHSTHAFGWPPDGSNFSSQNAARIAFQPAEHGFRFFPGFYRHVIDTLERIPIDTQGCVADNLVDVELGALAQAGKPLFRFPTKFPTNLRKLRRAIRFLFRNPSLGLTFSDILVGSAKLLRGLCMSQGRREATLEDVAWFEYMKRHGMSDAYRRLFIDALSQNFVAMDARRTSTKTAITILARLTRDLWTPGRTADRILNGPTSEAWIAHWHAYLGMDQPNQPAVTFVHADIRSLSYDAVKKRITGINSLENHSHTDPEAIYVLAVPVEAAVKILDCSAHSAPAIFRDAPSLAAIHDLKVNWMSGILYYLNPDVEMCPGHISYLQSSWAITSISQNQFWRRNLSVPREGVARNSNVGGVISAIVSDWNAAGTCKFKRPALEAKCVQDVAVEAFSQIREHVAGIFDEDASQNDRNVKAAISLPDDIVIGYCLDPAITFKRELLGLKSAREFVDLVKGWRDRPAVKELEAQLDAFLTDAGPGLPDDVFFLTDKASKVSFSGVLGTHLTNWLSSSAAGYELAERLKTLEGLDKKSEFVGYIKTNFLEMLKAENEEPLFINTVGSTVARPDAVTGIGNLFLASDYVKTATDLATMESANEAARRAVNGILESVQYRGARCRIFAFPEPLILAPIRWLDSVLFRLGW